VTEPIRRVAGAFGARRRGIEPIPALPPLERVERDAPRDDDEDAPHPRERRPERRPEAGDGHVDVHA